MSADRPIPFSANVPEALDGMRIDRAVSTLTGVSRSEAAELVAGGRVRVDGTAVVQRSAPLRAGSELVVELPDVHDALQADPSVDFTIVHEDDDFVVVDKPAGVVVHPGAGASDATLIAGLLARYPDIGALAAVSDPERPGVVHRIDKGTSGLLVVARSPAAYRSLVAQMGARTVGRRYLALVAGLLDDERGVVDAPIGRSTRTPTKMAVTPSGRPARTRYVVMDRVERLFGIDGWMPFPASLLACTLETGRTHQIRVHFAAIGHPVVGDDRYGTGRTAATRVTRTTRRAKRPKGGQVLPPGRLFLHAAELSIDHPVSGERLSWSSPLPADLQRVLEGTDAANR